MEPLHLFQNLFFAVLDACVGRLRSDRREFHSPVTVGNIKGFRTFVSQSVDPVLYDRILSLCQQAGFNPKIVQEVVPQQTLLGLVAAEIGISLLHASVEAVAPSGVVLRALVEPTPELELAVAWSPETTNPVLPAFLAIVREITCQLQ
ncbi:LysR family substrate-binding domain-containing protein [Oscillatoria sp. FACHB-1407]|uniref:LysR family substrate-binding domain-containing protein n=1 Tax=Oscillatoria sp. FACHB-1407 TaxID=2692847 RepID=UPI0016853802|nr:LysR family substrate-binding domain-containing protein [Oscillatoria sp. FACHB-1407]MBD2463126.1 LysR family substrate-binding domain-containing protein [Oscillatoria sp. FACHB-1407]